VLFIATIGEEKGLLGSSYYIRHPLVPLYKTIAAVNIDGIAAFGRFKDVVGVGGEYSDLGEFLARVAATFDLEVSYLPSEIGHREAFTRSDQIAFAEGGIPSILLIEGLRQEDKTEAQVLEMINQWGRRIYHSPFDDLNQPVDWNAVKQHQELLLNFCRELGDSKDIPEWYQGTPFINARLQSKAQRR
jgi:Zn-dependent M28 family amino/carboxypeptidase